MITKLSNNNIAFFDKLIPNDELDNLISRPDYYGIGVSRYAGTEEKGHQRRFLERRVILYAER